MAIRWAPDAAKELTLQVFVDDATTGHTLHWGDGTSTKARPGQVLAHTYALPGTYSLAVTPDGAHTITQNTYAVVLEGLEPPVEVGLADDNPYIVQLTTADPAEAPVARYLLDWGDGAGAHEVISPPGAAHERTLPAGTYTVVARNLNTRRTALRTVEVVDPVIDPDFDLAEDTTDSSRMTVKLGLTNTSGDGRTLRIHWGDGTNTEAPATPGHTVSHAYTMADFYFVQVAYADAPEVATTKTVDVPFGG